MILHLVLTLVILLVLFLLSNWVNGAPFGDARVKWCLQGIVVLIGIIAILQVWGILGIENIR